MQVDIMGSTEVGSKKFGAKSVLIIERRRRFDRRDQGKDVSRCQVGSALCSINTRTAVWGICNYNERYADSHRLRS